MLTLPLACSSHHSDHDDPINPYQASTGDMIFNKDNIRRYLVLRQAELDALGQRLTVLDEQILTMLGRLRRMDRDLSTVQVREASSSNDVRNLQEAIGDKRKQAEQTLEETMGLQQRRDQLAADHDVDRKQREADEAAIRNLDADVTQLENQNGAIDAAINSTIEMRVERYRMLMETR